MIPMTRSNAARGAIVPVLVAALALFAGCTEDSFLAPDRQLDVSPSDAGHVSADSEINAIRTADVVGQGMDGPVVAADAAELRRTPNGISVEVSMPTPAPGTYDYPEDAEQGHPEAFTLWVFVFNDPEAEDWDGAFWGAGHVVGGEQLTLRGFVSPQTTPFVGEALDNPLGAKVHLAVAPHGAVDAEKLPDQIQTPSGEAHHWWFALFD